MAKIFNVQLGRIKYHLSLTPSSLMHQNHGSPLCVRAGCKQLIQKPIEACF